MIKNDIREIKTILLSVAVITQSEAISSNFIYK